VTSYDDVSAQPKTTYQYRIRAFTDINTSGYGFAPPVTTWGGGTGLHADYFDNADFTGNTISQSDATVNFNWQNGAPSSGISPDTFSIRWTGQVQALESGTYQFSTTADDGVRLWVNGQLLIDRWSDVHIAGDANSDGVVDRTDFATLYQHMGEAGGLEQGDFNGDGVVNFIDFQILELNFGYQVTNTGSIALQAGTKYDIQLEYYQQGGGASIKLQWLTPSGISEVIPQQVLFPPPAPPAPGAAPSAGAPFSVALTPSGSVLNDSDSDPKKLVKPVFSVTPVVVVKPKVTPLPRPVAIR
jgi:hypothetical protein